MSQDHGWVFIAGGKDHSISVYAWSPERPFARPIPIYGLQSLGIPPFEEEETDEFEEPIDIEEPGEEEGESVSSGDEAFQIPDEILESMSEEERTKLLEELEHDGDFDLEDLRMEKMAEWMNEVERGETRLVYPGNGEAPTASFGSNTITMSFMLTPVRTISGTITEKDKGRPAKGMRIDAVQALNQLSPQYLSWGSPEHSARVKADETYTLRGSSDGTFWVRPVSGSSNDQSVEARVARKVTFSGGDTVTGIDFKVNQGG